MRCSPLLVLAMASLAACSSPAPVTELLVVVDSDMMVPAQLDAVRVEVSGATAMTATGTLTGPDAQPLPRTVGLVHRGGALGPIDVHVVGSLGGADVIEGRAITSFVRGKTLILPIMLSRTCAGSACGAGRTCSGGDCVSANVDPATLEEWNGDVPRLDGGACVPFEERCNDRDDDCDGRVDETFDLQTDPGNCGACGTVCARPNAMVGCAAATCTIEGCDTGFGDCDADATNGCETDVATSPEHCGGCGMPCSFPNAGATCAGSTCVLGACDPGFDDCDGSDTDGCETSVTTLTDCGACGTACSVAGGTATCATGSCAVESCDALLGDCDADVTTGCERALDTLTDCGGCDVPCDVAHASETCAGGTCALDACDAGFADCNGMETDGCERPTTTLTDCGGCGVTCTVANGTPTCTTGACAVASCNVSFGNCDGSAANGCETDLRRTDAHCGMCGMACPSGQTCRSSVCR